MTPREPIDVFVVFAGPDRERAARLCRALREAGLRVFSEHDLKAGDPWDAVLPERLRAARAVVVLISERWGSAGGRGESWYGPDEVALAIRVARKTEPPPRLIPVVLDGAVDCTPYGLWRVRAVQVAGEVFDDAATEIGAVIDPTHADAPVRPRDAVAAARERVENLRHGGASDTAIRRAEAEVLTARRAVRDGVAPREGEVFAERYLLIERLGDGGFATVWLAHDQRRGERVAVKVLHGRWRRDRSRIERFERGAMRMASLTHAAVVRVLEKPSSHDGWHFYVMEYLPGGDLAAARTRADAPLTAAEAITAVLTAADALAEAHRRGMVHRDVKPQNILLDASGRAKISDFDLVGADDSTGGTRTGALGTFLFAAPEALAAAKDATPAADVYGLAVTTVFALLGRVPAEVVRRPEAVVAELAAPAAVKALLLRSLAWEPEARPVDAEAFAATLRGAWAREVGSAPGGSWMLLDRGTQPTPSGPPPLGPGADAHTGVDASTTAGPTSQRPRGVDARSSPPAMGRADAASRRPTRRWLTPALSGAVASVVVLAAALWLWSRQDGAEAGETSAKPASEAAPSTVVEPPRPPEAAPPAEPAPPRGFVRVPAGEFMMGSPAGEEGRFDDEGPQHRVTLTRPLWVAAHEVTQAEWRALMASAPSYHADCDDCPVERVNWFEAAEYANRQSRAEGLAECYALTGCGPGEPGGGCPDADGKPAAYCFEGTWQCNEARLTDVDCAGYRLPTEAEWESFARAGTTTRYWSGDADADLDRAGWHSGNSGGETRPVGGKAANPWGLYDVHGNVFEWTGDWFGDYAAEATSDPAGPPSGVGRVCRGGSWVVAARVARSAFRLRWHPGDRYHGLGFRLVRLAPRGS